MGGAANPVVDALGGTFENDSWDEESGSDVYDERGTPSAAGGGGGEIDAAGDRARSVARSSRSHHSHHSAESGSNYFIPGVGGIGGGVGGGGGGGGGQGEGYLFGSLQANPRTAPMGFIEGLAKGLQGVRVGSSERGSVGSGSSLLTSGGSVVVGAGSGAGGAGGVGGGGRRVSPGVGGATTVATAGSSAGGSGSRANTPSAGGATGGGSDAWRGGVKKEDKEEEDEDEDGDDDNLGVSNPMFFSELFPRIFTIYEVLMMMGFQNNRRSFISRSIVINSNFLPSSREGWLTRKKLWNFSLRISIR